MTGRRRWMFAVVTVSAAIAIGLRLPLAADLYVHQRVQNVAAVNIWGYRGPVVGRTQASAALADSMGAQLGRLSDDAAGVVAAAGHENVTTIAAASVVMRRSARRPPAAPQAHE
jgi:hypothetical protein